MRTSLFFFALALALPNLMYATLRVDVFTTSQFPINTQNLPQGTCVHLYKLDGIQQTLKTINGALQGLAPDMASAQAHTALQQHMDTLKQDFQGLMLAKQYGIEQLPTVLINQEVAIIGATDVASAIQKYLLWKTQQNN